MASDGKGGQNCFHQYVKDRSPTLFDAGAGFERGSTGANGSERTGEEADAVKADTG